MKKLHLFWVQYKHLIFVSILSGCVVVTLQMVMQTFSQVETNEMGNIKLTDVSVSVIPINDPSEFVPEIILNAKQQLFFDTVGWVRDTSTNDNTSHFFEFENLAIPFDEMLGRERSDQVITKLKLPSNLYMNVSICAEQGTPALSCKKYATNKAGLTIPIHVTYIFAEERGGSSLGTIVLSTSQDKNTYKEGIFSLPQPVVLDMSPI